MLEDDIYKDYVHALKSKDKDKVKFLSFIRAGLKNRGIELKKDKLEDSEALSVLKKEKKSLLDSKEIIEKSGRKDQLEQINSEINIINAYLPEPLSNEKMVKFIDESISETGAVSLKDMGKVMKLSLEKMSNRAEAREVSRIVKEKLSAGS